MCDCLNVIEKHAKWPFYKPLSIDPTTLNFKAGDWTAKLFRETPTGRISQKSAGNVILNYCPICGICLRLPENKS